MELAAKLWESGIKAEFGFKPNPKMGDQLTAALEQGIPFMVLFGEDELQRGVVKVGSGWVVYNWLLCTFMFGCTQHTPSVAVYREVVLHEVVAM